MKLKKGKQMTDQQDRQAFEEWWAIVHPRGTSAFFTEDHWSTFQAALRIAEERRKKEEPVAWVDVHCSGDFYRRKPDGIECIPLILRDNVA